MNVVYGKNGVGGTSGNLAKRLAKLEEHMKRAQRISKTLLIVGAVMLFLSFTGAGELFGFFGFSLVTFSIYILCFGFLLWRITKEKSKKQKSTDGTVPSLGIEMPQPKVAKSIPPVEGNRYSATLPKAALRNKKRHSDIEADIGTKWFGLVGIVSLVIGMAFFVKYAFDHGWIGPVGRIVIGILVGILTMYLGEFLSGRKYVLLARTLTGGGFSITYFTTYAAYHFYQLVPAYVDSIALAAIVLLAIFFALRYDSKIIAAEAFLLGYLTAYLAGESSMFTLVYGLILTLGLLGVVYKTGWVQIGLGGIVAMYLTHYLWFKANSEHFIIHLCFIGLYAVIFIMMTLTLKRYNPYKNLDTNSVSKYLVAALLIASALSTVIPSPMSYSYLIFYLLLAGLGLYCSFTRQWPAISLLSVVITYYLYFTWYIDYFGDRAHVMYAFIFLPMYFVLFLIYSFFMAGSKPTKRQVAYHVIFMIINAFGFYAFLYQEFKAYFDVYTGIFTLGLSLFYLAASYLSKARQKQLFVAHLALCVTFLTLAIPIQLTKEWITISWIVEGAVLTLLGLSLTNIQLRIMGYLTSLLAVGKLLFIDMNQLAGFDIHNLPGSIRAYTFITAIILFYVVSVMLNKKKSLLRPEERVALAAYSLVATGLVTLLFYLETNTWTSAWWTLQMLITLCIALKVQKKEFRYATYALSALTASMLLFRDSRFTAFSISNILGSTRFLLFTGTIIVFYLASYLLRRNMRALTPEENIYAYPAHSIMASVLVTTILSLELEHGWISIGWAVFAIILIMIGFARKEVVLRLSAIVLFGITILKVFFVDLQSLETFYRIVSFIVLGIILLLASYIYTRYKDIVKKVIRE